MPVGTYGSTFLTTFSSGAGALSGLSRFNPSNPNVAGAEWFGARVRKFALGAQVGRSARIAAQLTESIDQLAAYFDVTAPGASNPGSATVCCDVYDLANPIFDTPSWAVALPVSNDAVGDNGVGLGQGWQKYSATVFSAYDANAWQNVNDLVTTAATIDTAGTTDNLAYSAVRSGPHKITFHAGAALYNGDTGALDQTLSGKRVAHIEIIASVRSTLGVGATLDGVLTLDGVDYISDPVALPAGARQQLVRFVFPSLPSIAGVPWSNARAQTLVSGAASFGIRASHQPTATGFVVVASVMLWFRLITERRVAFAVERVGLGSGWRGLNLKNVDGGLAPWAKVAAHNYLLSYYMVGDSGVVQWRGIDCATVAGFESATLNNVLEADLPIDNGAPFSPTPTPPALVTDVAAPAFLLLKAGAASKDSQPYGSTSFVQVGADSYAALRQGISTEAALTYGVATVLVRVVSDGKGGRLQDAPLEITLKRTSDDVALTPAASLQPADVDVDGKWHVARVRFPSSAALAAGQAVYLELTSASARGWDVSIAIAGPLTIPIDALTVVASRVTVGGDVDVATLVGAGTAVHPEIDFLWSIGIVPPLLTGLTSAAGTMPNNPAGLGAPFIAPTVGIAMLAWDPSALGAAFSHYIVERLDYRRQGDVDGTWNVIARITDEAASYCNDPEPPLNVAVSYRVTVIRSDGGHADWATFTPVVVPSTIPGELDLTTAFAPDLSIAARMDESPNVTTFPIADKQVLMPILGSRFPLGFTPPDGVADKFNVILIVTIGDENIASGATPGGRAVFDAFTDLLYGAPVAGALLPPYIVVRDYTGRRRLCLVRITATTEDSDTGTYTIELECNEITATPTAVVTASPWVP